VQEDERVTRLRKHARRQHGVFTLAQALSTGHSRPTVRRRLDAGAWQELAPRVYRAALAADADWRALTMARALSIGGVACRRSALALYGLSSPPDHPEVLVSRGRRTAARVPQPSTDQLPDGDVTTVDGIPATTPVRTLIDMAGRMPLSVFEDVFDTAIVQRLVKVDRLGARARELWAPRRNGCAIVLALLDARDPDLRRARNLWEARVLRVVRELGLSDPRVNYRVQVGGKRRYLDLAWPEAKVAVEFDGFVPHSTRRVFDDDRSRQNDLVADGWTVFRITKTMLDVDPTVTFGPVAFAVAAKR
jgi:very-short-patch-repair endonuclease